MYLGRIHRIKDHASPSCYTDTPSTPGRVSAANRVLYPALGVVAVEHLPAANGDNLLGMLPAPPPI